MAITIHRIYDADGQHVSEAETPKAARELLDEIATADRKARRQRTLKTRPVKIDTRTLYDVIDTTRGETVGTHEDQAVANLEAARLDAEAAAGELRDKPDAARGAMPHMHLNNVLKHQVVPREVTATDDPDDGAFALTGPMVSDGNVTARNLKRGERPPEQLWTPS